MREQEGWTAERLAPLLAVLLERAPCRDCRRAGRRGIITTMDREMLDSIVDAVAPEKIILFGSAARGDTNAQSDLDLLVVKDKCHQMKTAARIYHKLPRPRPPVDAVVVWPEDLVRHKDTHWLVIGPALKEGRTIYESAPRT